MPRKVMMALVPAGGGHGSAARAIAEALSELAPDLESETVNVSAGDGLSPVNAIPQLYAAVTVRTPSLWRAVFHATNGRRRYALADAAMQPLVRPRVNAMLRRSRPDVVVSLNPALGPILRSAIDDLGWRTPLGIVVSDLITLHHGWFCRGATWHAVPTEQAWQACVAAGIAPETVHVTGQPVRSGFCRQGVDRRAMRRGLGLPLEGHVVLVAGGGDGFGQVESTVEALLASGPDCLVAVIAGRNEGLRRRLNERMAGPRCRVLGYVANMADWMWAADVLVGKAGPNTVMEAVHCGLPMVVTGAIPGQEEANLGYVEAQGLGLVATRPVEIAAAVRTLLGASQRAEAIRRAMVPLRRPGAAAAVARLIVASLA